LKEPALGRRDVKGKAVITLAIADWQLAIGDYFPTNQSEAVCKCFALIGWKVIANRQLPIGNC